MLSLIASPAPAGTTFEGLLTSATRHDARNSKNYALDHGVDETVLVRYANGAVSTYEHREIQSVIARCKWARDFVVDQVKRKRVVRSAA
jgi:hypothetical protein